MTTLFFYGTLCDLALLEIVLGHPHEAASPAKVKDIAIYWADGEAHPMAVKEVGAVAHGLLVPELSETDLARLNFYEGGFAYQTIAVEALSDGNLQEALIYMPDAGLFRPGAPWSLSDWQEEWGATVRETAREVMGHFGVTDPMHVMAHYPAMLARAQARLRGADSKVRQSTSVPKPSDVEGLSQTTLHSGFFRTVETRLRFPKFDGDASAPVTRVVFEMADAVTLLPYDPKRDAVLMVEQFRMGPFHRNDPNPWLFEPVAGRVDAGESYETAARREAEEEAGLSLGQLYEVGRSYPSPGAISEYLVNYVGVCDLPETAGGVAGLASEQEDIRSHVLPLDEALELADAGNLRATPLLATLYWLDRHRARIQREVGLSAEGGRPL